MKRTWKQFGCSCNRGSTTCTYMERKEIVNISRAFLDTNGAHQETTVEVESRTKTEIFCKRRSSRCKEKWLDTLG